MLNASVYVSLRGLRGSAETLSKEANLMRTAVRYKVETSKITGRVTAELSKRQKGHKVQRHNLQKAFGNGH